jgi:CubicO group peptidase (beta-lactamase class C family)
VLTDICRDIEAELRSRPEFAHTSHFLVMVDGQVVHDAHYRGPAVADIFSITKAVVATLTGIAVRDGLLADLDLPVEAVVGAAVDVGGSPSAGQTVRHLLTMTRGSRADGPYEIDEVMALPAGWLARIIAADRLDPPGTRFRYDNGATHLLGAVLVRLTGMALRDYAARHLFGPLGIHDWHWPRDPDGLDYGFAHLRLRAADLARLGTLWLDGGAWEGRQLVDPGFAREMTTAQSAGGPPENCGYGYGLWVDDHGPFAGGWAGQHVTLVPPARAVIVTTGDPRFDPGPPPTDELRPGWRPARDLVVEHLVPALSAGGQPPV